MTVQRKWREGKAAAVDNCETVIFCEIEEIQVLSFFSAVFCFVFFLNLESQMPPLDWVQTSRVIKRSVLD